jgi:3-dehydroquinate synthase
VGVGVALDTVYASLEGRLPSVDADRTLRLLERLGIPTWHPALANGDALLRGLEEFREHLGGRLTITLLRAVGAADEVHALDPALVRQAIARLTPKI